MKDALPSPPRVLIVGGEPFQLRTATGLTLSSLFRGWPSGGSACIYTAGMPPDLGVGIPHRRLSLSALHTIGHWVQSQGDATASEVSQPAPQRPHVRGWIRGQIRMALDLVPYSLPDEVSVWIDEHRPELIYSMLGSARVVRLALELADARGLPIVPHFMDDWPRTLYRDSVFAPCLRVALNRQLRRLLARSHVRLTIGDEMSRAYERRYGGPFLPFMNCVDLEPLSDAPPSRSVRLAYVGGLHLNRWRSLAEIGAAIEVVSRRGTPVELVIYTSPQACTEYGPRLNRSPYMRVAGHVSPERVPSVQKEADILVHVEAFDRVSRDYTRYSISTKLPEYMAVGRPVLAYGPPEAASLKYVEASRCGVVVSERSAQAVQTAVADLVSSPGRRRQMGLQGRKVAEARHDAVGQRAAFCAALRRAVSHGA